jgi:hypothetical protein
VYLVGSGHGADLRRVIASSSFTQAYGDVAWPARCTQQTFLAPILYHTWRIKPSVKCTVTLRGEPVPCRFDAFNNGKYGYYVLVFPEFVRPPRSRRKIIAA